MAPVLLKLTAPMDGFNLMVSAIKDAHLDLIQTDIAAH